MNAAITEHASRMHQQNAEISDTFSKEKSRLRNFIRQRVPNPSDAEDILQDVFYEFIAAYRLPESVEQVGAWLIRVARNRIIDRFRKKREEALIDPDEEVGESERWIEKVMPASLDDPEMLYARKMLIEQLIEALNHLPKAQRQVFVAHELDGKSFKEISAETGTPVNTLLARKRYAILFLRTQLQHHDTH